MTVISLANINPSYRSQYRRRAPETKQTPCDQCGADVGPFYYIYRLCNHCLDIPLDAVIHSEA